MKRNPLFICFCSLKIISLELRGNPSKIVFPLVYYIVFLFSFSFSFCFYLLIKWRICLVSYSTNRRTIFLFIYLCVFFLCPAFILSLFFRKFITPKIFDLAFFASLYFRFFFLLQSTKYTTFKHIPTYIHSACTHNIVFQNEILVFSYCKRTINVLCT